MVLLFILLVEDFPLGIVNLMSRLVPEFVSLLDPILRKIKELTYSNSILGT